MTAGADMPSALRRLLAVEGVRGVLVFTPGGEPVASAFAAGGRPSAPAADWYGLAAALGKAREAELVFERGRVYVRRAAEGVVVVAAGPIAPGALIRLNGDLLLAALRQDRPARGLKRFFRR